MKQPMKTSFVVTLIIIIWAGAQAGENSARNKAIQDGWPDTPVGIMASQWIEAFSTDEETVRTFLTESLTKESLANRSIKRRMASYRDLFKRFGRLMLSSVLESNETELTAMILAEDANEYRFTFKVGDQSPHKLVEVTITHFGH